MTQTKLVESEINRFLADVHPEVISVSGDWGVGKTYTWQKILDSAVSNSIISLGRYSYVSLFGINSLESLRSSVFENSEFLLADDSTTASKARQIGNDALGLLQKGRSLAAALPYIGKVAEQSGPLLFSTIRNQIICIDDLERRGSNLSVKDVLGLVTFLKEQRSCKVVLLLNQSELGESQKDYLENLEKTVDIELKFAPTPDDCVRIALSRTDFASICISKSCVELGIKNIRVIKKIERLVRSALSLTADFKDSSKNRIIRSITLLAWVRLQPKIAPPMHYVRNKNGPRLWGLGKNKNQAVPPEEVAWESILEEYGFRMDELSQVLYDGVEGGYFDPDKLKGASEKLDDSLESNQKLAAFNSAWRIYHDSFGADEDEFKDALYKSSKDALDQIGVSGLNAAVTMLKELGEEEKAQEILKLYVDSVNLPREDWQLENHMFANDVSDPDVKSAFAAQATKLRSSVNFIDALRKVAERGGWNDDDLAALNGATVQDYVDAFKGASRDSLSSLINAVLQFGRVSNASKDMLGAFELARDALIVIGKESRLNARRVAKYGVIITD